MRLNFLLASLAFVNFFLMGAQALPLVRSITKSLEDHATAGVAVGAATSFAGSKFRNRKLNRLRAEGNVAVKDRLWGVTSTPIKELRRKLERTGTKTLDGSTKAYLNKLYIDSHKEGQDAVLKSVGKNPKHIGKMKALLKTFGTTILEEAKKTRAYA